MKPRAFVVPKLIDGRHPSTSFGKAQDERQSSGQALDPPSETQRWVVKLDFVDAKPDVHPIGQEQTEAIISYFKGAPDEWHAGLPTYSRIVYADLWPGIDLVYYGTVNQLKYEFIVHPGADPAQIRLAYRGVTDVALNAVGQLEVRRALVEQGFPVLTYEGNVADSREFDEARTFANINAFMEAQGLMKLEI